MNKVKQLSARFTARSEGDRKVIEDVVATMDSETLSKWESELVIHNGSVAGSKYADLADILTYNQFVSLHTAMGYEMPRPKAWDYYCPAPTGVTEGCKPEKGYGCIPENCPDNRKR